jgi:hypothetical protein
MGRQWLLAKRQVNAKKRSAATSKLVKEIAVAAKLGGADPDGNARLFAAIEKARKESCSRDVIERAIKKGAGVGEDEDAGSGAGAGKEGSGIRKKAPPPGGALKHGLLNYWLISEFFILRLEMLYISLASS